MARQLKSLQSQVDEMRREWPQFGITAGTSPMSVMWFGPLVGMERSFTLSVQYGLPLGSRSDLFRLIPLVRVLSPSLVLNFDAEQEAPLPHVYFEGPDYRLSPLCLFDPAAGQWNGAMSIARTTIPWAARWLACYELWEATGRWHGGGRHQPAGETKDAA